jgi:integrase
MIMKEKKAAIYVPVSTAEQDTEMQETELRQYVESRGGRQLLSYTFVWESLRDAAQQANIGHVSSRVVRHTYRSWLDSIGTPVGMQQNLMRHADIRTTMNIYGDAATADMRNAHEKVFRLVLPKAI